MKRSTDFKVTPAQRRIDKRRAELAFGRPIPSRHPVHHHSPTQLVICENTEYHALLHQRHYAYRMKHDPEFGERQIDLMNAQTAKIQYECELIKKIICKHTGLSMEAVNADLERQMAEWQPTQRVEPFREYEFNDEEGEA